MEKVRLSFVRTDSLNCGGRVAISAVLLMGVALSFIGIAGGHRPSVGEAALVFLLTMLTWWFVWETLKSLGLLPAATVVFSDRRVTVRTPLVGKSVMKGELVTGQPFELTGGLGAGGRNPSFKYVLSQGDSVARFDGPSQLRPDAVEALRVALAQRGSPLTVSIDYDKRWNGSTALHVSPSAPDGAERTLPAGELVIAARGAGVVETEGAVRRDDRGRPCVEGGVGDTAMVWFAYEAPAHEPTVRHVATLTFEKPVGLLLLYGEELRLSTMVSLDPPVTRVDVSETRFDNQPGLHLWVS